MHRPEVVLLDEPTVGVDPQSRERVFAAVLGLARAGAAVLYSTHQMDEAERLCDRLLLLDHGQLLATGTPTALVAEKRPPAPGPAADRPCAPRRLARRGDGRNAARVIRGACNRSPFATRPSCRRCSRRPSGEAAR